MGTTAAMLLFSKHNITLCNIGDSRIFRISENEMFQVSMDHVSIAPFGKKPFLSQNLGIPPEEVVIEPYFSSGDYFNGDKYLICSDGLTDMVSENEICQIICSNSINDSTNLLLQKALENGGRDNVTIILLEVKQKKFSLFK
jgi:protein phosphatase